MPRLRPENDHDPLPPTNHKRDDNIHGHVATKTFFFLRISDTKPNNKPTRGRRRNRKLVPLTFIDTRILVRALWASTIAVNTQTKKSPRRGWGGLWH
jgi:hypothetical protein